MFATARAAAHSWHSANSNEKWRKYLARGDPKRQLWGGHRPGNCEHGINDRTPSITRDESAARVRHVCRVVDPDGRGFKTHATAEVLHVFAS